MKTWMPPWTLLLLLVWVPALAQQSTSYTQQERALNAGGSPAAGQTLTSPGFSISLSSLGDGPAALTLGSFSFQVQGGLVAGNPPPAEVLNVMFMNKTTLVWEAATGAAKYNLYRGDLSTVAALGYGLCSQPGLTATTANDTDPVFDGSMFFYLVTAVSPLGQEGTKGTGASGLPRLGTACP